MQSPFSRKEIFCLMCVYLHNCVIHEFLWLSQSAFLLLKCVPTYLLLQKHNCWNLLSSKIKLLLLFVCLGYFIQLENFSLICIRRCRHCRWRATNVDLCSTHIAIEQWRFFSVLHLLWHVTSVYNSHLLGPVTLTPIYQWSCHNLFFTT